MPEGVIRVVTTGRSCAPAVFSQPRSRLLSRQLYPAGARVHHHAAFSMGVGRFFHPWERILLNASVNIFCTEIAG